MLASVLTAAMLLWGEILPVPGALSHGPLYAGVPSKQHVVVADLATRDGAPPPASYPQRPAWFLPELEYALPVGIIDDENGWPGVQRVLKDNGADRLRITGLPDDETLRALLVYVQPLMHRLIKRAHLAERRALNEKRRPSGGIAAYGNWNQTPTEGHYSGEMYFPPKGDPSLLGYVRVSGSGWPDVFEYYRPGEEPGSPLCSAVQFGIRDVSFLFICKLLDGEIRIEESNLDQRIAFFRKGERIAGLSISVPHAPRGKTRQNPPLDDDDR